MSRKLRFILVGLGVAAIVVLAWVLLLDPLRDDIAVVEANIQIQETRLATALAELAQAETTQAEGEENRARLLELAKMVPLSDEMPSLMLQIQDLAEQSGIEFMSVTPGASIPYAGYQIVPLSLVFTGTYFDLSDFVWRAEQLVAEPGRLLAVKQVGLQMLSDTSDATIEGVTSPLLQVQITLYAFQNGGDMLVSTAPPLAPEPDSGAQQDETATQGSQGGS